MIYSKASNQEELKESDVLATLCIYLRWLFFSFFLFFNFTIFCFTMLYWFCHKSTWICHGCTCVPYPEPASHLPPHTLSLGHPSAPAPSILYPASNLDWRFITYMILYMFQCHSPKSSHPLPLPQSPKETQMYRTVFWTLWERERVGWFEGMSWKHV